MILTIDIGNTNAMFRIFKGMKILRTLSINIQLIRDEKKLLEYIKKLLSKNNINGIIISSVVPDLNKVLKKLFNKYFSVNPYFISDIIRELKIKTNIKNKNEIGSDRIVNVIYAQEIYTPPILIVDFGTATTIDYINKKYIYEGGIISPGIDLSLKSLYKFTAKLPLINFNKTKYIIGNTTNKAIRSGFYWGYIAMIQGLIERIKIEKKIKPEIILTGGNATFFKNKIKNIKIIDKFFIMRGLNFIYRGISKNG